MLFSAGTSFFHERQQARARPVLCFHPSSVPAIGTGGHLLQTTIHVSQFSKCIVLMNSDATHLDAPTPADAAGRQHDQEELRRLNVELERRADDLKRLNQTLIDSEQRLRLALETGRIGLWVWNSTDVSNSGDWSQRLKEIFGLPLDAEVTHDMFLKCVHPDDRDRVNDGVMQALAGKDGGVYRIEYRSVHPGDGSEHWVTARGQAFFDAEGRAVRFIGTVMDITDRKREEESATRLNIELEKRIAERTADLARSNAALHLEIEERKCAEQEMLRTKRSLRVAIDTIPGLVWSSQPDGHIDYLNQRWLDYTGLTLEEASGWGWQQAIHPDDLSGLVEYWTSILTAGTVGEYEARLRRHDGVYRWFLFRGVPLPDDSGRVVKWYGTNTDVEALRASEHLARGQMESLTRTLTELSRESEPEKFLEHVLRTIGERMGAHSIGVWELNASTGRVQSVANCEGDRLHLATKEELQAAPQVVLAQEEHPVWTEFFRSGKYCVAGEIEEGRCRVRILDGTDTPWHDWRSSVVADPNVPPMLQRLSAAGVASTLSVPMFVAGKVTGFLSIRFRQRQIPVCHEIELTRALAHQAMLAIQLMRLSRESRAAAVAAERNRLARDIHDTLAQGFTGIIVQLEAAADATAQGLAGESVEHVDRAAHLARRSLQEARRSVQALRPQALEEKSLCGALEDLIRKATEGTALRVKFTVKGQPRALPSEWEGNILRIGQEVLTNALRHAQANEFEAHLEFTPETLRLALRDNGCGFDPAATHEGFGLVGIKERIEIMGGELALESEAGQGTAFLIVLPLVPTVSSSPA